MAPPRRSHGTIAFLLLLARVPCAGGEEALPREWNQAQGNARHTAFVDVAPIKIPPQELWRVKVGELVVDPVVSQGKLYAVVRDGKEARLVVLEVADGAVVVKTKLDAIGDVVGIAAVDGLVVVAASGKLVTCRLAANHVRWEKSVAGGFAGAPTCFAGGVLVESSDGFVVAVDLAEGKAVGKVAGYGSPVYIPRANGRGGEATTLEKIDPSGNLDLAQLTTDVGAAANPGVSHGAVIPVAPIRCDERTLSGAILASITGGTGGARGDVAESWYAWIRKNPASSMLCERGRAIPVPFKLPPAIRAGVVFGFDTAGKLISVDAEKKAYLPFIKESDLPAGASVEAPSIARDVLYVGNWAVEIDSRRVLWCRPELKTRGPAIPVGDERLVVATPDGELVALTSGTVATAPARKTAGGSKGTPAPAPAADPTAAKSGEAAGGAAARSAKGAARAPLLPGSLPGVVRADGEFVAGKVTALDTGRWRVEPDGAAPIELDAAAVAVADPGSGAKLQGDQYPLFRACLAALNAQHVAALLAAYERWKELKFFEECRRLADEARRFGLAPERADEMVAAIAGRKSTTVGNADVQRRKCLELENAARVKVGDRVVAAAKWCADAGAPVAATAVRMHESDFVTNCTIAPSAIADWVPANFPYPGTKEEMARTWANWAEALLPSGARFFTPSPQATKYLARTPFANCVTVRTDFVELYTLEFDPKVIGPCLSRAEATVRTLKALLGRSPSGAKPDKVVSVFLYANRAQYLGDKSHGAPAATWTAGFYSPDEALSRFYSHAEGDHPDPLGRSLYTVMAHELTHHYCDRVWNPASNPGVAPGFWMVEGFAEFVAGQQVEMDRLGGGLDDATVLSLDLAAAALRERQLLPFEFLLGLDQAQFASELDGGEFGPVQAKHTLAHFKLDRRKVFYVESAALTYFVMNKFGKKGRDVYVDWFARLCRAQPRPEPWKDLGFGEMADFEKAFRDFLAGL
jgi:outer membrane protein assembly factor BamB